MPKAQSRILYVDHIVDRGRALFHEVCKRDLEGIVARWKDGTYQCAGTTTSWLKIRNSEYSQMDGRHELFAARG